MDKFKKQGFQNGLVHFPGIDMLLDVPKNRYFRNDGIVVDIDEHTRNILGKAEKSSLYRPIRSEASGLCLQLTLADTRIAITYIIDRGKYSNMLTFGHESMHAIRHLGLESQLLKKLDFEGLSLRPFSEYSDEEVIAGLGSIIADYNFKKFLFPGNPLLIPLYNALLQKHDGWSDADLSAIVRHTKIPDAPI